MAECGKSTALLRLSIFLLFKRLQISPSIYPLIATFSKCPPSQINCPYLQTVESFWKLVSKDSFPKLQDFALKGHSIFESTHVRENTFSILSTEFFKENVRYLVWICRDPI